MDELQPILDEARAMAQSLRGCATLLSPFFDEWGASVFISALKDTGGIRWVDSGGIEGASRRVVSFGCDAPRSAPIPFIYLKISPLSGIVRPPISEALNALREAGFDARRDVGDLFPDESSYYAIAIDRQSMFSSVSSIETETMLLDRVEKSVLAKWERKPQMKTVNSVSTRLDAVVSSTMSISRSKAKKLIEAGLAMINYSFTTKAEKPVETGDIISMKSKSRVMIGHISDPTKRGRFNIEYSGLP